LYILRDNRLQSHKQIEPEMTGNFRGRFDVPERWAGVMELTFSCASCGAVGQVSQVETKAVAECRQCGRSRALRAEFMADDQLQACPLCMTTDLYVQKDFPQGLGLFIVVVGFAISTIFWYYEMPIPAYLVLVASGLLDLLMYHLVGDVTICYRCLCQLRGVGSNRDGRYRPFDLTIGERYRQERIRAEQLRERGAQAE
jgi:hypothetical protein